MNKPSLRVSATTRLFQSLLLPLVQQIAPDGLVRISAPFQPAQDPQFQGITLHLFQVERDPQLNNLDLPTRTPDGLLIQRPVASVDLLYLLTFYGQEERLIPQSLLGNVLTFLHSRPRRTRAEVEALIELERPDSLVEDSLLVEVAHYLVMAYRPLSVEELGRLWPLFQIPYTLSLVVRASGLLLESDDRPATLARVETLRVSLWPGGRPGLVVLTPRVSTGDALEVELPNRDGRPVKLLLGAHALAPDRLQGERAALELSGERVAALGLRAGAQPLRLQVDHGAIVATASFMLIPEILRVAKQRDPSARLGDRARAGQPRAVTLAITARPAVGQDQRVQALAAPLDGGEPQPADAVEVREDGVVMASFEALAVGRWRVELVVDGAHTEAQEAPRGGAAPDQVTVP